MTNDDERRDVAESLLAFKTGDSQALDRILPLVYEELRRVARGQLRGETANHSLDATALVHEVYLRLVNVDRMTVQGRAHFLWLAARLMRQILVDHARRKRSEKRGGDVSICSLEGVDRVAANNSVDVLALDEALEELATLDARQRDVVVLKFFGGLTIDEAATALNVSPATVERDWTMAKAWLYKKLQT